MRAVTVSQKFQVAIPKEIRGSLIKNKNADLSQSHRADSHQAHEENEGDFERHRYGCEERRRSRMSVMDSSARLSYFADDDNIAAFSRPIEKVDKLLIPSITITEVFKCIFRQRSEDLALGCVAHMEKGKVVAVDSALAFEATHYGMKHKLPLAGSIIYAIARNFDAFIWTQDGDFESLKGVKYFARKKHAEMR